MSLELQPANRKILVIDDDWLNRELLETYLVQAGYQVLTASDGAAGLNLVTDSLPDLVLCDVQMPRMTGYEVCAAIKANPATQFLPVVMVTALDSDEEKLRAVEAGADDFITKPFNSILLLTRVRSLLRIKHLHDLVEERNRLLHDVLTRYLAEGVVQTILTDPERHLKLGGELRPVSVLFADIRGFTAFTEQRAAHEVVDTLNQIFPELIRVIFSHHGTFDKFLGDAVMAFWGAPLSMPDDSFQAVLAAVEMRETFSQLIRRDDRWLSKLGLGIGLNFGDATVGNIGSEKVMDYTAIGDTVNVAKRLQEGAASGEILISQAAFDQVKSQVLADKRDPIALHGRLERVTVYAVKDVVK
jgi:class 3 adenylate cyclase